MLTRAIRRVAAKIGIGAVLFTQLAVAAYACPELNVTRQETHVAMTHGQAQAAMPAGGEIPADMHDPNLCQQHCQIGTQSVTGAEHVSVPVAVVMPLTVVDPPQPASALTLATLPVLRERETGPPPLIRFQFFRI